MNKNLNLLFYFLKKDLKARYAGSGLGMFWTILMPLIQIVLFWFVFSAIMGLKPYAKTEVPYTYFLLSTFFFWLAFVDGLIRSSNIILENGDMVKKVSFPNVILPITATLSLYIQHMVGFLIFILFFDITKSFSVMHLMVIPVLAIQLVFSIGAGMLFAAIMPYVRDIGAVLIQFTQALFFLSPILYSLESVPQKIRFVYYFNPMTYFVSSYHNIILFNKMPQMNFMLIMIAVALVSIILGYYVFKKMRPGFADVL